MNISDEMKCSVCGVSVGDDAEYRMRPPIQARKYVPSEGTQSGNPLGIRVEPFCPKCAQAFDIAQESSPTEV
jgi:hypothetical protein